VDFVVERSVFPRLPFLIDEYCTQSGWHLCQVLRHETTAAYFVCSALDDPCCAVALDACSDYQRNGTVFLSADELLKDLRLLSWGGHGLSLATELRYRFAKAAAKDKHAGTCAREFSRYPAEALDVCSKWLLTEWGIPTGSWKSDDLRFALGRLRSCSRSRPPLWQPATFIRVLSRIRRPTGLMVVLGPEDFATRSHQLAAVFGYLYFRRVRIEERPGIRHLCALVTSNLVIVPTLDPIMQFLTPKSCIFHLYAARMPDNVPKRAVNLAGFLHSRLARQFRGSSCCEP
jgi:hypothetical protein